MKKLTNLKLVSKNKQAGASMIEYAVIAALVVAIAVVAFPLMGDGLEAAFTAISAKLVNPT